MTDLILNRADPAILLSHVALAGLGAILEHEGADVRIGWTGGSDPRPLVTSDWSHEQIGHALRTHAARVRDGWASARTPDPKGKSRGTLSPRRAAPADSAGWAVLEADRVAALDGADALDQRLLTALGRPAYWRSSRTGNLTPDEGASRWEMQPRNQGSEFVGNRLHPLAVKVASRTSQQIVAGLAGETRVDEVGKDQPDSRTPTGLAQPGPTDNALAWCALWGLSYEPLGLRTSGYARCGGHVGRPSQGWFFHVVWKGQWRPAKLRSVLAAPAARAVASVRASTTDTSITVDALTVEADRMWLAARDVQAVYCFPVSRHGSDSAPERRAGRGVREPVGSAAQ